MRMDKSWKNPWTNFGQRLRKPAVREPNITKINSMDSLLTRAEELDFRRDLMEHTPESFSGGQIIDLLHGQRRICDVMEREVREDFASHGHELQEASWNHWTAQVVMIVCGGNLPHRGQPASTHGIPTGVPFS